MEKKKLTIEEVKKLNEYKDFLYSYFEQDELELLERWNLYCDEKEQYDNIIALSLHEAIENTGDESITNIIDLLKEKKWKYNDGYFTLDKNRNIISSDIIEDLIDIDDVIDFLIEDEYMLNYFLTEYNIEIIK